MATPIPTDLATLLPAIKAMLVTASVVPSSASCYISLTPEDLTAPIGDSIIVLVPQRQTVREDIVYGAGNAACWITGGLQIVVWTRLNLDRAGRHDDIITDATLGLITTMTAIAKTLQQSIPQSGGSNLLTEPMRLTSEEYAHRKEDNVKRISGTLTFEFSYHRTVS